MFMEEVYPYQGIENENVYDDEMKWRLKFFMLNTTGSQILGEFK